MSKSNFSDAFKHEQLRLKCAQLTHLNFVSFFEAMLKSPLYASEIHSVSRYKCDFTACAQAHVVYRQIPHKYQNNTYKMLFSKKFSGMEVNVFIKDTDNFDKDGESLSNLLFKLALELEI